MAILKVLKNGVFQKYTSEGTHLCVPASAVYLNTRVLTKHKKLTSVSFEEGSMLDSIMPGTFEDCIYLESIELPPSLREIGKAAFKNCTALRSIEIPASVVRIDEEAFNGCKSLESVTFAPDSQLSSIRYEVFHGCPMKSIRIPASVGAIGHSAFIHSALESVHFEKNSRLDGIDEYAFGYCPLRSIRIPTGVRTVRNRAFICCSNLERVIFANEDDPHQKELELASTETSKTSVMREAFLFCDALKEVTVTA